MNTTLIEQEILGSFLIDADSRQFIDDLTSGDFENNLNKKILKAIKELIADKEEVNIISVHSRLNNEVDIMELTAISSLITSPQSLKSNISILKDNSARKQLKEKASKLLLLADDNSLNADTIKDLFINELNGLGSYSKSIVTTLKEAYMDTIEFIEQRYYDKDNNNLTGIRQFDKLTAGLLGGDFVIIGSRPAVGKTCYSSQISEHYSKTKKVLQVCLEMNKIQMTFRTIAGKTKINTIQLRSGDLTMDQWTELTRIAPYFENENLVYDFNSTNVLQIKNVILKEKPDLVIIDYLQLLEGSEKNRSRQEEVAGISKKLKRIALDCNIPIIALSQLTRMRGNRPTLEDLRESGSLEQDADIVMFLHDPTNGGTDYTQVEELEKNKLILWTNDEVKELREKGNKLTEFIVAKNRNGGVGNWCMVLIGDLVKFFDVDGINSDA